MIRDLPSLLAGTFMVLVFGLLVTGAQTDGAPPAPDRVEVQTRLDTPGAESPLIAVSTTTDRRLIP